MTQNEFGSFPKIGETFQVVVGDNRTETQTASADIFQSSQIVYASKDSGVTWWPIPSAGRVLNEKTLRFYLGKEETDQYDRCEFSFPFFMTTRVL